MSYVREEIASQPDRWRKAAELARAQRDALPADGARLAVVGCGTSLYVAQAYAVARESAGLGETDAFPASEMPTRDYDALLAISRSGTTTEVLSLLSSVRGTLPTVAITADPSTPIVELADRTVAVDFADEKSVVQTRSATSVLALLRAHLGQDVGVLADAAERALTAELPAGALEASQFTFLGRGWTIGLANEAALKLREAALAWAESYPAMEYRHGPISVTDQRSAVWMFGEAPAGLADEVRRTGALWIESTDDPQVELVKAQRLAVELAERAGIDPDNPRNLTRSIILEQV